MRRAGRPMVSSGLSADVGSPSGVGAPVAGLVLAAGSGVRFGGPKVLAEEGDWLSSAVASLAEPGCAPVLVTVGAAVVDVPEPGEAVLVPDFHVGLSASVRRGIDAVPRSAVGVVVIPVDVPTICAEMVDRVVAAVGAADDGLARAVFSGRLGHPVYLGARHLPAVRATLSGDRGAGMFLAGRGDVVHVECGDLGDGRDHDVP